MKIISISARLGYIRITPSKMSVLLTTQTIQLKILLLIMATAVK